MRGRRAPAGRAFLEPLEDLFDPPKPASARDGPGLG